MGFVLDWQKKLGYRHDPFQAVPSKKVEDYIVGREKEREKLNLFVIKKEKFGILHGPEGSGKTTLLLWLQQQLKAHFLKVKVILLQGQEVTKKKAFFARLLHESLSFLEKTVTKPHEEMKQEEKEALILDRLKRRRLVILVDDANDLDKENKSFLKELLDEDDIQVLLVLERVLKEHEHYGPDKLKLSLKDMPAEELRELLGKRIDLAHGVGTFPFEQQHLKDLIEASKRNPVKLLELARTQAIELSLKVQGPPERPKTSLAEKLAFPKEKKQVAEEKVTAQAGKEGTKPAQPATKTQPAPKKKGGWFSIKLVKSDEKASPETKEEEILDEELAKPKDDNIDTQLLQELVETASDGGSKEQHVKPIKKVETAEVEEVIQSLVEELDDKK